METTSPRTTSGEPDLDEDGYPIDPVAEVISGLFQADTTYSPAELFRQGYTAVFDLCGFDRGYGVSEETYVVHPIDDVPWIDDPAAIHALGVQVASLVRSGGEVVVNCMAGLNRSGLLVGRALIVLGYEPARAIELIRRARGPQALSNHEFARFLLVECSTARLASLGYQPARVNVPSLRKRR